MTVLVPPRFPMIAMWPSRRVWILTTFLSTLALLVTGGRGNSYPTPPLPLGPLPSASQLAFQERELAMFFHFGMNTFTDVEWGNGTVHPSVFNPDKLDTDQWMSVAKAAGFKLVILTVKHHDGFCLWPTLYTNYSVASSPWRNGKGDVVGDFVASAMRVGLRAGLYLSPWDRHDESYGSALSYNEHYLAQLGEILSRDRSISEVFLDGAKGDSVVMTYYFQDWFAVIEQLQPGANIFSDSGPSIRWVGNEYGEAGSTCWSMMNRSLVTIGQSGNDVEKYLNAGDEYGVDWVPPECDLSIRPGWFWHSNEEPWSLETLLDIYYKSVGRNCVLLLNVPPNSSGLISDEDARRVVELKTAIDSIFSVNLVVGASATANSTRGEDVLGAGNSPFAPSQVLDEDLYTYWAPEETIVVSYLDLELKGQITFNVLKLQEAIFLGQRVSQFSFLAWVGDTWQNVTAGTTIGFKRLLRFGTVNTNRVRLQIEAARGSPLISSIGLYLDSMYLDSGSRSHSNILSAQNVTNYYFKHPDA